MRFEFDRLNNLAGYMSFLKASNPDLPGTRKTPHHEPHHQSRIALLRYRNEDRYNRY